MYIACIVAMNVGAEEAVAIITAAAVTIVAAVEVPVSVTVTIVVAIAMAIAVTVAIDCAVYFKVVKLPDDFQIRGCAFYAICFYRTRCVNDKEPIPIPFVIFKDIC